MGLARLEPNRDPVLSFPTSGRSWAATLPMAKALVDAIAEGIANLSKSGNSIFMYLVMGIMVIVLLTKRNGYGCMYIVQDTCCKTCGTCDTARCTGSGAKDPKQAKAIMARFCYMKMGNDKKKASSMCGPKCGGNCAPPKAQTTCEAGCDFTGDSTAGGGGAAAGGAVPAVVLLG